MRSALFVLALASATVARAGIPVNDWYLSDSDTHYHPVSDPWVGERTLYVWTTILTPLFRTDHAEFGFTGTLELVSFTPRAPWTDSGTAEDLVLERASCLNPSAEVVGELVVRDPTGAGGRVCFRNGGGGRLCARGCDSNFWLSISHQGFASDGEPPCDGYGNEDCYTVAVEENSWGRTKATYR
jgi:hypothetical protein